MLTWKTTLYVVEKLFYLLMNLSLLGKIEEWLQASSGHRRAAPGKGGWLWPYSARKSFLLFRIYATRWDDGSGFRILVKYLIFEMDGYLGFHYLPWMFFISYTRYILGNHFFQLDALVTHFPIVLIWCYLMLPTPVMYQCYFLCKKRLLCIYVIHEYWCFFPVLMCWYFNILILKIKEPWISVLYFLIDSCSLFGNKAGGANLPYLLHTWYRKRGSEEGTCMHSTLYHNFLLLSSHRNYFVWWSVIDSSVN